MHVMFLLSEIILKYEITSKMPADIHTKAFRDPMAWKQACLLINILEEIFKGMRFGTSCSKLMMLPQPNVRLLSKRQDPSLHSVHEYSIIPPDIYVPGMTGKVRLQELEGRGPIVIGVLSMDNGNVLNLESDPVVHNPSMCG